jgi:hypothetical protein
MQAVPGSKFQVAQSGTVELSSGEMLAIAGDKRLRIETAVSAVLLDPGAVAVIKTSNEGQQATSVVVVDEPKNGGVAVRVPGGQFFALHASESLNVSDTNTLSGSAAGGSAPGSAGQNAALAGGAHKDFYVMKAQADVGRLMRENPLIQCVYQQIPTKQRSTPEQYGLPGKQAPASKEGLAGKGSMKPISYESVADTYSPAADSPAGSGSSGGRAQLVLPAVPCRSCSSIEPHAYLAMVPSPKLTPPAVLRADPPGLAPSLVKLSAGEYELRDGDSLFAPTRKIAVKTNQTVISINKDNIVLVMAKRSQTRVLNLHDVGFNDVKVNFGKFGVTLHPGQEIDLLEGTVADGQNLMVAADNVAHRRMRFVKCPEKMVAVLSDFSLVSAFTRNSLLSQLRESEDASDKKIVNTLYKTTAALFLSQSPTRGPYYLGTGVLGVAGTPETVPH